MIESITKRCAKCGKIKTLDQFHRQPSGPEGRHSWCKTCANKAQRRSRVRHSTPERRRAQNFKTRYGLTKTQIDEMRAQQSGLCALCPSPLDRPHIDHDHKTGKVRSLLCHRCNIGLGFIEAIGIKKAAAYLEAHA